MQRTVVRGTVLVVALLCATGMVLPTAATGSGTAAITNDATVQEQPSAVEDTTSPQLETTTLQDDDESADGVVVEHVYVNLETDRVYRFGAEPQLSELPDGNYLEIRTIETSETTNEKTRRVNVDSGTISALATTSDYDLTVRHAHNDYEASYTSGSEIDLWIGAANASGPVGDVNLTVTIQRPDGVEETFTPTVGSDGNTVLSYDTSGKPSGQYDVTIESEEGVYGYDDFVVGTQIRDIFPGIGDTTTVGSEVTATVLLTENATPVTNTQTSVTIIAPDGTETTKTVTTDDDGFGTFSFTPSQKGRYSIDADNFHQYFSLNVGTYTGTIRVNGEEYSSDARPGSTVGISGQLQDDQGAASQVPLTLQLVRNPYDEDKVVANLSVTTDSTGTFYEEWQVPSDASDGTEYEVRYVSESGAEIAAYNPDIDVRESGQVDSTPTLSVDITTSKSNVLPDDTVELSIEATTTDSNGQRSAYANEQLTVLPLIDYGHAVDEITVQTDSSGQATVTYTIPAVPDGSTFEFQATADFNGSVSTSFNRVNVQQYIIEEDWDNPSKSGGTASYDFSVTDTETGNPVSDFPLMIAAERSERRASVYATETLRTNSSGEASTTVTVPDDANGDNHFGTYWKYESTSSFPVIRVPGFDAQLTGLDSYEYAAGETVSLTYDGPPGSTAILGVQTWSNTAPTPLTTTQLDAGEQFTFTIPTDVPQGTSYNIQGFAANSDGQITNINDYFRIEGSTGNLSPTAAFSYEPSSPTTDDTLSFDGSSSVDDDGTITAYEWDFNGDGEIDATGETTTHQYDTNGTYDVTLTVTDDAGATDSVTQSITVSTPASSGATVTLDPADVSLAANGSTTVDIVVENTSEIAAYEFALSVAGDSGIQIADVIPNGNPGTQSVSVAADGHSANVSAALASVEATDSGATLATIQLTGESPGNATLETNVETLGDESGTAYNISDGTASATVTVQAGPGDVTGNGAAATDPDGDGVYEDITGDGTANVLDVQALFDNLDAEGVSGNAAFDINSDGTVNILDVQALFSQI